MNIIHFCLCMKLKGDFMGIPRIELGTFRSLSEHPTTGLNPRIYYFCRPQNFLNTNQKCAVRTDHMKNAVFVLKFSRNNPNIYYVSGIFSCIGCWYFKTVRTGLFPHLLTTKIYMNIFCSYSLSLYETKKISWGFRELNSGPFAP